MLELKVGRVQVKGETARIEITVYRRILPQGVPAPTILIFEKSGSGKVRCVGKRIRTKNPVFNDPGLTEFERHLAQNLAGAEIIKRREIPKMRT